MTTYCEIFFAGLDANYLMHIHELLVILSIKLAPKSYPGEKETRIPFSKHLGFTNSMLQWRSLPISESKRQSLGVIWLKWCKAPWNHTSLSSDHNLNNQSSKSLNTDQPKRATNQLTQQSIIHYNHNAEHPVKYLWSCHCSSIVLPIIFLFLLYLCFCCCCCKNYEERSPRNCVIII